MATIESTEASFFFLFFFFLFSGTRGEGVLLFGVAPRFHSFQCASFILHPHVQEKKMIWPFISSISHFICLLIYFWTEIGSMLRSVCIEFSPRSFLFPPITSSMQIFDPRIFFFFFFFFFLFLCFFPRRAFDSAFVNRLCRRPN